MAEFISNIEFEIPEELAQRKALLFAIKFVMSNYLNDAELQSLFTILGLENTSISDSESSKPQIEKPGNRINELVEQCDRKKRLYLLIGQLRLLKPTIWYEHIWLLVRPHFYLPQSDGFFVGRYEQQNQIVDALLQSPPPKTVVIRGINGIGKTALALEIARLLKKREKFEDILWLSIQSGKATYMEKVYEWDKWLHELAITFNWNIETQSNNGSASNQQYWDKLKTSKFLLCVDGIDDLNGHEELINFLNSLSGGGACKAIITTILELNIKNKLEVPLGGFKLEETENWLHQACLSWNIIALKQIDTQRIEHLHDNAAGIPQALAWHASQLISNFDNYPQNIDNLRNISSEMLMEKIFEASFNQLSESTKELLLALSIFNWPATRTSWEKTADINNDEFESYVSELTNLSLVKFDTSQNRYSLSSIAKDYCNNKLRHTTISGKIYSQWIEYFQLFSAQYGGSTRRRYDLIEQEWANLWQAVQFTIDQWSTETPDFRSSDKGHNYGHSLVAFADSLVSFCRIRGYTDQGMILCRTAVEAADTLNMPEFLGPLAYMVGWIWCDRGEFQKARQWAAWASSELDKFGRESGYAERLSARIEIMAASPELDLNHPIHSTIERHLNKAKNIFEDEKDKGGLARILSDWGMLQYSCKEYAKAYDYHLQALKCFRDIGDIEGESNSLVNLGDATAEQKDFSRALEHYREALVIIGKSDFISVKAEAQRGQANVLLDQSASLPLGQKSSNLENAYSLAQSSYEIFIRLYSKADVQRAEKLLVRINLAIASNTVEKNTDQEEIIKERKEESMVTPQDQLAVGILIEGVKFLFNELGRRLEFWREKKGEEQTPKNIEVVRDNSGKLALKLDDIQKTLISIDFEDIKSSQKILRSYKITLNSFREELAKPNLEPSRKAGILVELPELENKIEEEGLKLQSLIEQSFKK